MAAGVGLWSLGGCAGAPAPAASIPTATRTPANGTAHTPEEESSAPVAEEAPKKLPTECVDDEGDVCTPPADFAEHLCQSRRPDVALALFSKETPWTRAWVRSPMEAWYASGGRSGKHQLRYAEEVLVIAKRTPRGGIQVSGAGSFDVVRWDGSCVSLMEGELSFRHPGTVDVAVIPWKRLDQETRKTLSADTRIGSRNDRRIEACKGNKKARKCETAMLGLSRMIANYVRAGGSVPAPKILP